MSNSEKYNFELRFPEFKNKNTWANRILSEILFEHKEKSTGKEEVFSVSVHKGVINQIEHLGRAFAANNTDNYKRVLPGDIIYTKSPTGDFPLGIIKQSKVSHPVIVSPLYGVFTPETIDLGVILDAYFHYPERTINYLSSIVQKGAKNTINIKNETFISKSLILPTDKLEQKKIAHCLSSLDDVITSESQRLELLTAFKKGLVQNLLPKAGENTPLFRFKQFENSGDWIESNLIQVADYENGKAHEQDIAENGEFIVANSKFISTDGKVKKFTNSAFCQASKDDILMVLSDVPNGKAIAKCFWVEESNRYTVNQRVCRLTPKRVIGKLLYYLINRNPYFLAFDDGVKQTNLRKEDVLNCPLLIPEDPKEQEIIADTLTSVDDLIKAQNQKLETLQLHKKGLLQGLFPNINKVTE